mmetsp:Transcript_53782/g.92511  ORF Transcript_53782/g.92511 Transcript_53782/m.92511 type:complete len:80 (-) Transcript_53782:43-282(-)
MSITAGLCLRTPPETTPGPPLRRRIAASRKLESPGESSTILPSLTGYPKFINQEGIRGVGRRMGSSFVCFFSAGNIMVA